MGKHQKSFHYFLAIVVCVSVSFSIATDIRLTGLATRCAGRVEIYYNSSWRTVCRNNWDMNGAEVVCTQMKCGKVLNANHSTTFGLGTGSAWLEYVACPGKKIPLTKCEFKQNGTHNCGHSKGAGVVCSGSLQQPDISIISPDRGLVWSNKGAEITTGYSFVITCSTDSSYTPGRFVLVGPVSNRSREEINQSASFHFPAAYYEHQGNYSCVYEVSLSSGNFTSTKSGQIQVIITLPWLLLIISVAAGSVLLLLLVLLVVWLVMRRRKQFELPPVVVQTQMNDMNSYKDDSEDEGDYVNVESGDATRQMTPAETEEDSDGHDYEGMDSDNSCVEANISAVHYKKELEDKEDTSDDENDYVNLAESFSEPFLDIYGDDVYQNF